MKVVVIADARPFRRAVGVTAWAVLEELVLDAHADEHGLVVAATNVRRVAAQLGVSKDTAARAIRRLAHAGVVNRVVAERGDGGALPMSSYAIDLSGVEGLSLETDSKPSPTTAETAAPARRPVSRADDAQTSLFDLPADVS